MALLKLGKLLDKIMPVLVLSIYN